MVASALLAAGGCPAAAMAAPAAKPTVVRSAKVQGAFSATVVEGVGKGTAYNGTLSLSGTRTGLLSGTLQMASGKTIPSAASCTIS